ncbi:MAG: winged helix-turn-helix domain-containing protein [Acidobacteriota bacterium]
MERITYEFGPFQVDTHERIVRRDGKRLPLTPKVFDILLVLLNNPGKILPKEEVMKLVWPDTAVEESNLARNVSTLRKVLREDANHPKYIETIPWRGYRFMAEVRELREETNVIDSLAVLPFVNDSRDPELEYLSDGITESLIHRLSLLSSLKVMSRYSVFRYKTRNSDEDLPDAIAIGSKLRVCAVLTGHVGLVDDVIQVGVELVDTFDNRHLWGAQYNREFSDISTLQETISQQIAVQLELKLTSQDKRQLSKHQTEDSEAYQLYLKGRYFSSKMTLDGIQKAVELLQQATQKDPAYALAYIGLVDCFSFLNQPVEARKAAAKAMDLEPELGEAHASLGFYKFLYDWDFPGAEREFQQAIELTPNYAQAHHEYAIFLSNMGRHEEAIHEAMRASELDPLSMLMNWTLGPVFCAARQYDNAMDAISQALELDPHFAPARSILGMIYAFKGMLKEALEQFERLCNLAGGNSVVDANIKALIGLAYATAGQRKDALQIIEAISNTPTATFYNIARIHAVLGENDRAFDCLDRAYRERSPEMVGIMVDPSFDNLTTDPRFRDLLVRVGFG